MNFIILCVSNQFNTPTFNISSKTVGEQFNNGSSVFMLGISCKISVSLFETNSTYPTCRKLHFIEMTQKWSLKKSPENAFHVFELVHSFFVNREMRCKRKCQNYKMKNKFTFTELLFTVLKQSILQDVYPLQWNMPSIKSETKWRNIYPLNPSQKSYTMQLL